MSLWIRSLVAELITYFFGLTRAQLVGISIGAGVLVIVFFATVGVNSRPVEIKAVEFRPYQPVRRSLPQAKLPGDPRFPGSEPGILEEIKSLRGTIDELRSSMAAISQGWESSVDEKVIAVLGEVKKDLKSISSDIGALKEKLQRDKQPSNTNNHATLQLLAIASSSGLNYALLRTEEGDKSVTEGDRVGPWMVVRIEHDVVHLDGGGETRLLRLESNTPY